MMIPDIVIIIGGTFVSGFCFGYLYVARQYNKLVDDYNTLEADSQ